MKSYSFDDTFSENQHRGTPKGTQCGHRKHAMLHTKSLKNDYFWLSDFKSLRISEKRVSSQNKLGNHQN